VPRSKATGTCKSSEAAALPAPVDDFGRRSSSLVERAEANGFGRDDREGAEMAGKPVHVEIGAPDTQRALRFYGDLFGWEFQAFEGSPTEYHTARFSEDSGGAIYASDSPRTRVYYDVDDIRSGRDRVQELGGSADEPMPVPGMGWFVTCEDPVGNAFGLWETDPDASMPG
jgi:predicted enzyme related to lactoylglutathione lyase